MQRSLGLLGIIAAAWLAAPAAMAGSDIIKCTDAQGRVTLTDQPCAGGAAAVKLVQDAGGGASSAAVVDVPPPQRHVLPAAELRHPAWQRPNVERPAPLARDIATLKAARRALLLMDGRPTLAGLQ